MPTAANRATVPEIETLFKHVLSPHHVDGIMILGIVAVDLAGTAAFSFGSSKRIFRTNDPELLACTLNSLIWSFKGSMRRFWLNFHPRSILSLEPWIR